MARTRRFPSFYRDRRPSASLGLGLLLGLIGAGIAAPSGCVLNSEGSAPSAVQPGAACTTAAECDDNNLCTIDECTNNACVSTYDNTAVPNDGNQCTADTCVKGEAKHTVQPDLPCGEGGLLKCNAQGECAGCDMASDCGMPTECTTWNCNAETVCEAIFEMEGKPLMDPAAGDCKAMACNAVGEPAVVDDDLDVPPDDGVECTVPGCLGGEIITPTPFSPIDTPCTIANTYCNAMGTCVPCTATIGCTAPQTCYDEMGCVSCNDTMQNGDETGVDCGGTNCLACDGQPCTGPADCVSNNCDDNVCISCTDDILNGNETAMDCGGSCPGCATGQACGNGGDCANTNCFDQVCCNVECGGACRSCNLPGLAGTCTNIPQGSEDNAPLCSGSNVCSGGGSCVADQGKGHYGENCFMNNDCFNNLCDVENICRLQNGAPCSVNIECVSDDCEDNVCDP